MEGHQLNSVLIDCRYGLRLQHTGESRQETARMYRRGLQEVDARTVRP